ncbi:MAG: PD-(D/E)XK nuclease family protein [Acidobacteriota bacterium]|nr:PD-(D/E)XK nuclease family protein [Acidobacteriota bacterium]
MFEQVPHDFSWSASRHGTFENCRRAYFFHYYLALGKVSDADPGRSAEARRLRAMTTVPMWVGSQVHDTIERLLRTARRGGVIDVDAAVAAMLDGMRRDYVDSRDDLARKERNYKGRTRFHEHEYGPEPSPREWKQAAEDAESMVRDFVRLDYLETVRALDNGALLALEDLQKWDFHGVGVWVKIDLAYRDAEGRVNIVDWKTGRRINEDNPLQMTGYASYAHRTWDAPLARLAVREVYLRLPDPEKWCRVDDAVIEQANEKIEASIRSMLSLLDDPSQDVAGERNFDAAPEEWRCRRCNFRGICPEASIEA